MATVALMGFTGPASAGQASPPAITIQVQNEAQVPAGVLTGARAEVTRVYRQSGVETVWTADTTADLIIVVRGDKMAERMSVTAGAMGQAIVSAATGRAVSCCSRQRKAT